MTSARQSGTIQGRIAPRLLATPCRSHAATAMRWARSTARIIGELRAVVSELTKRSNAAHASNADR
jgi:hypothetical protein